MKTYLIFESIEDSTLSHINMDKARALISFEDDRLVSLRDNFNISRDGRLKCLETLNHNGSKSYIIYYEKYTSEHSWAISVSENGEPFETDNRFLSVVAIEAKNDKEAMNYFNLFCEV